jgi:ABC-type multidrug transport system permease subunit
VLAEAPVSALISAISGATLYPLVGFQRSLSKFGNFLTSLCLEGLSAGAIGLLLGAAAPSSDVALALFPPITVLTIIFNGLNIAEVS